MDSGILNKENQFNSVKSGLPHVTKDLTEAEIGQYAWIKRDQVEDLSATRNEH